MAPGRCAATALRGRIVRRGRLPVRRDVLSDKAKAFAETRRVLRKGGVFLFNVWDRIEENEFADEVTRELALVFPDDPPRFMARTPHGHYERGPLLKALADGGFPDVRIEVVAHRSRAPSPRHPAIAYCQGTPLRNEIEARDASRLGEATDRTARAIAKRFGEGAVNGKIQALVATTQG
jgi:SAM-dependent methyltransferase